MKNDLYLHSENLEYINFLIEDVNFTPRYDYPRYWIDNSHPNEVGLITTELNNFHIILGSIASFKCPWCDTEPNFKYNEKGQNSFTTSLVEAYYECPNCGACGPKKLFNIDLFIDEKDKKYLEHLLKNLYINKSNCNANILNKNEL